MGSAKISLRNDTDAMADMAIYHFSSNYGSTGIGAQNVPPGGVIGPFKVHWNTATPADFWYVSMAVSGGSQPGMYVSHVPGDELLPYWKECMLVGEFGLKDDGSSPTFTVDWSTFKIKLKSGACSAGMLRIGDYSPIQHVFVLMLENRSFDNIFAFSGIPGLNVATSSNYNTYNGTNYYVGDDAPSSMPTDPGHEFTDVLEQLAGEGITYTPPDYPTIQLNGFAANYATSTDEGTGKPGSGQIGDIMLCFDTPTQLPNIFALGCSYVLCNRWFSSLPGPTWPNRFYLHGASSAYQDGDVYVSLDDSPSTKQIGIWESVDGFTYREGSIFDALDRAQIPWRIYHDTHGTVAGSIPQVTALKGITLADPLAVKSLDAFASDIASGYPYRYTFIEPNYGDITGNTYKGGSSQHPEDDVAGGENLIGNVYNTLARSPLWPNSLLVITYDEHGGFYDSYVPYSTVPPDTQDQPGTNKFIFDQLGVRVPAVIISPLLHGQVDQTIYDHSSVLATIEKLFGLDPLTARDASANDFTHLITDAVDTDAKPLALNTGRPRMPLTDTDIATREKTLASPIPDKGNIQGFLNIARKADRELTERGVGPAPDVALPATVRTYGDADTYIRAVMTRVMANRANHEAALRARINQPGAKQRTSDDP